jgi:parvulin-like peptidyl-prolyl isomerase
MFFLVTGYPEQYRQMITKDSFLEQLINEELLMQEANKLGIVASDEEAEGIFNNVVNKSGISIKEIDEQLALKGFDEKDLKDYYKKQLTMTKLVNQTVFSKMSISDNETKEFYNENIDMFKAGAGEIRVSHILVNTEEEVKEILAMLKNGSDFKELAIEKSIEPAAKTTGGDLGFFGKGQMIQEFEDAAFALKKIGELSEPVKTEFGWHIIRKEADTISFEDAKDRIASTIKSQKEQEILKAYVDGLKAEAKIEIFTNETKEGILAELENKTTEINETEIIEEPEKVDLSCVKKYGITNEDNVIFYYASWSPRSKAMIPIVDELKNEGYDFYMAEIDTDNVKIVQDCFKDVISEHIPEFICAGSRMMTAGEMSKESLKKFADECKS